MQKKIVTWRFILYQLQQQVPVILLYVVDSKGSSPGRTGFMMAVAETGETGGSIGGGIMEHKFVALAKACLLQSRRPIAVHRQLHDKQSPADQSGMICSGEQTNIMYLVQPADKSSIQALIQSLENHGVGTVELSGNGIRFYEVPPDRPTYFLQQSATAFVYRERTGYGHQLFIIGGGHCALALSQLVSRMDFFIHILDDREQLPTLELNNFAHQKTVLKTYEAVAEYVPAGNNSFVVIMTEGYRTDALALECLLGREYKYLGLLGSSYKVKKLLADLIAKGISPGLFKTLHAPVGIAISSQTPEEIAVSIAAEIIRVKNQ